jgi:hypothetical protein
MRYVRTAAHNSIESPTDLKYVSAGNDSDMQHALPARADKNPRSRKDKLHVKSQLMI